MSIIGTVCSMNYYCVDYTSRCRLTVVAQTHHRNGSIESKNRPHSLRRSRLGGLLSRPLQIRSALRYIFIWECIPRATLVCAYGTAIVSNRGSSELTAERIRFFYALQKGHLLCNCL